MDEFVQALPSCASRGIRGILSMIPSLLTGLFVCLFVCFKDFFLV